MTKTTKQRQEEAWARLSEEAKARVEAGRAYFKTLTASAVKYGVSDPYLYITCGRCGEAAPAEVWTARPIAGDLPPAEFQCPACSVAFRRTAVPYTAPHLAGQTHIELQPIQARF